MGAGASYPSRQTSTNKPKFPAVRKHIRNVPLEVICLGLPRTGTASLREALRYLGYGDVYHFATVYNEQPGDAALWQAKLLSKYEGGPLKENFVPEQWDQLLGNCGAVTDIPCVIFAKDLIAAHPNAKFILTVRDDAQQWQDSYDATIKPWFRQIYEKANPTGFKQKLKASFSSKSAVEQMSVLIQKYYLGPLEEAGMKYYDQHNEMIKSLVKQDRLLIYNVKSGWAPLVGFLGQPPQDTEFPRLNERDGFPRMFTDAPPPPYLKATKQQNAQPKVDSSELTSKVYGNVIGYGPSEEKKNTLRRGP